MKVQLVLLAGVLTLCQAGLLRTPTYVQQPSVIVKQLEPLDTYPQYNYGYSVQDYITGDSKRQEESREGDLVRGSYSLVEPDGTLRTVTYTADKTGFHAIVDRQIGFAPAAPVHQTVISRPPPIHFQPQQPIQVVQEQFRPLPVQQFPFRPIQVQQPQPIVPVQPVQPVEPLPQPDVIPAQPQPQPEPIQPQPQPIFPQPVPQPQPQPEEPAFVPAPQPQPVQPQPPRPEEIPAPQPQPQPIQPVRPPQQPQQPPVQQTEDAFIINDQGQDDFPQQQTAPQNSQIDTSDAEIIEARSASRRADQGAGAGSSFSFRSSRGGQHNFNFSY